MLDHLDLKKKGDMIRNAIAETLRLKDRCTKDLGGNSGTTDFCEAIKDRIKEQLKNAA